MHSFVIDTVVQPTFSNIFEAIFEKDFKSCIRGPGEVGRWKNQRSKISCQGPFNEWCCISRCSIHKKCIISMALPGDFERNNQINSLSVVFISHMFNTSEVQL
jgi:hypothetical protein